MTGGAGHIADMVNRMKENQKMRQARREQVRDLKKIYLSSSHIPTTRHASPENLENIKEAIRQEAKQKKRKARKITVCILGIILILILWLILKFPFQNFASTFL